MKKVIFLLTTVMLLALSTLGFADAAGSIDSASNSLLGFFEKFPGWIVAATTLVTAATAVTMITPSKSDDAVVNAILRFLNILAGNIAQNKNKDE